VDTVSPETTIESGPSGMVASAKASFDFTGRDDLTDVDDLRFECKIDAAKYKFCNPQKDYTELSNGEHTFSVRAMDVAGNVDETPARRTWTVCKAADPPLSLASAPLVHQLYTSAEKYGTVHLGTSSTEEA
jgi:hypothetical protein